MTNYPYGNEPPRDDEDVLSATHRPTNYGYQQPTYNYPPQRPQPSTATHAQKRTGIHPALVVLGLIIMLFAGCGVGVAIGSKPPNSDRQPLGATQPAASSAQAVEKTPEASETTSEDYTPKPSDFTIKVKVTEKSCYGSAGCNITFRIAPVYTGPKFDSDKSVTVSYRINGGDDPKIGSFDMNGDGQANIDSSDFISVPSSQVKLTAKVTQVL